MCRKERKKERKIIAAAQHSIQVVYRTVVPFWCSHTPNPIRYIRMIIDLFCAYGYVFYGHSGGWLRMHESPFFVVVVVVSLFVKPFIMDSRRIDIFLYLKFGRWMFFGFPLGSFSVSIRRHHASTWHGFRVCRTVTEDTIQQQLETTFNRRGRWWSRRRRRRRREETDWKSTRIIINNTQIMQLSYYLKMQDYKNEMNDDDDGGSANE